MAVDYNFALRYRIMSEPAPRSFFVTSLGWTGILGGLLGVFLGALPLFLAVPLEKAGMIDLVKGLRAFGWSSAVGSTAAIVVSVFLLRRKEWARKAMIGLLGLSAAAHAPLAFSLREALAQMRAMAGDEPLISSVADFAGAVGYFCMAVGAGTCLWMLWSLARPKIKAEFS